MLVISMLLRPGLFFDLRRALFGFAGSAVNDLLGSLLYLVPGLLGRMTSGFGGIFGAVFHGCTSLLAARFGPTTTSFHHLSRPAHS